MSKSPDSIGTYALVERHDSPEAADGILLRYQRDSDSLWADVYLYPGPDLASDCDFACAQSLLEREATQFVTDIQEFAQRGFGDTMALRNERALTPSAEDAWLMGRYLHFFLRIEGEVTWSDQYLYYLPKIRVKVRATYAPDSTLRREIEAFAAAVVPTLMRRKPVHDEPSEPSEGITISPRLECPSPPSMHGYWTWSVRTDTPSATRALRKGAC